MQQVNGKLNYVWDCEFNADPDGFRKYKWNRVDAVFDFRGSTLKLDLVLNIYIA